jgi:hypothetical protein
VDQWKVTVNLWWANMDQLQVVVNQWWRTVDQSLSAADQ